jgi:predicted 3-demethylubiquinone-9 3-methyltransferase (glyoxalase superfamily)
MTHEIYPCLWFDGNAKEAVEHYCSIFENSKVISEEPRICHENKVR